MSDDNDNEPKPIIVKFPNGTEYALKLINQESLGEYKEYLFETGSEDIVSVTIAVPSNKRIRFLEVKK